MSHRHRMFFARPAESVGELLGRVDSDVVVLRRTPDGDVLVSAPSDTVAAEISAYELAEAFGG